MRNYAKITNIMIVERNTYLQKLLSKRHNGMIKVLTGMRRCGKSFLLFNLFAEYLKEEGIDDSHIIKVNLEDRRNKNLRNPDKLLEHIDSLMTDNNMYYILLDEVQMVNEFEDVLNSYLHVQNADVYVTGSNAKFLSKDVITEFRGRGDEIRIHPFSFKEYCDSQHNVKDREQLLERFMLYGGLPQVVLMKNDEEREDYLRNLFTHTYLKDIKERNSIQNDDDLEELVNILASSIGGLTNPLKIHNTFKSIKQNCISRDTIKSYLDYMQDAFLTERSLRYDIKGRKYIDTPSKYYFEDLGLRNARLNFRQSEKTHLMENLIYNELRLRGFAVDVGQVTINTKNADGKSERKHLEVDFVCNKGYERIYIQSAFALLTEEKQEQEFNSLRRIKDNFQKIVIMGGLQPTYKNNDGILILNIYDFLMNDNIM